MTRRVIVVILLAALVAVAAWSVVATTGAKRGGVIAFFGSLALCFPPVRQMIKNLPFSFLDEAGSSNFQLLEKEAYKQRLRTYTGFSWLDASGYLLGALLLAIGLLYQTFD